MGSCTAREKLQFWARGGVKSNRTNFELIFRFKNGLPNQSNWKIFESNESNYFAFESNFEFSVKKFFEFFRIYSNFFEFFSEIFFSKLQTKRTIFSKSNIFSKHIICSLSLEKMDQSTIEIVLKFTNSGSKDS